MHRDGPDVNALHKHKYLEKGTGSRLLTSSPSCSTSDFTSTCRTPTVTTRNGRLHTELGGAENHSTAIFLKRSESLPRKVNFLCQLWCQSVSFLSRCDISVSEYSGKTFTAAICLIYNMQTQQILHNRSYVIALEGVACNTSCLILVHLSLYTKAETLLKGLQLDI